jgi:hypothetical protein
MRLTIYIQITLAINVSNLSEKSSLTRTVLLTIDIKKKHEMMSDEISSLYPSLMRYDNLFIVSLYSITFQER